MMARRYIYKADIFSELSTADGSDIDTDHKEGKHQLIFVEGRLEAIKKAVSDNYFIIVDDNKINIGE